MSVKSSDGQLRELLMEKTGEVHRLKAEIEKYISIKYAHTLIMLAIMSDHVALGIRLE